MKSLHKAPEDQIRQRADTFTHADAVVVEEYDDYTEVRLLYHPPETDYEQKKTPLGVLVMEVQKERKLTPREARIKMKKIFEPEVVGLIEKDFHFEIVMLFN